MSRIINMEGMGIHGDVIFTPFTGKLDKSNLTKLDTNAVAFGEVTGHLHAFGTTHVGTQEIKGAALEKIPVAIFEASNGDKYVEVTEPTPISHQEHLTHIVEPGVYKIGIAKQLDPFTKRIESVAD